jgi:hypothetical protein
MELSPQPETDEALRKWLADYIAAHPEHTTAVLARADYITMIHSVTGGIFRSVDMMIPRLLELRQRNEKKLADGSVKMQDPVKTAASRLMI